ncbi:MAG TPA: peptidoglycan-binding protein [Terriglobales bacterium]|nr:peptidoglycan-binding protein [Terriglobales bacterium]
MRSPRLNQFVIAILCMLLAGVPAMAASKTSGSSSKSTKTKKVSSKSGKHGKSRARRGAWKRRGQQGIKEDRAREIQAALIREGYLQGEATGQWDARTQAAMQKFQADNGWQSKVTPDSRALIKLGLGPEHKGLLNPETAAVPAVVVPGGVR